MAWEPGKHLNGSGKKPEPDTNVTSLDEARKRAAQIAKLKARAERGPNPWRDWIIGGVLVAMALGLILSWLLPLLSGGGVGK